MITLGSVQFSNRDFLEEKYHASYGKFDNEIVAWVSPSFGSLVLVMFLRLLFASSLPSNLMTHSMCPLLLVDGERPLHHRFGYLLLFGGSFGCFDVGNHLSGQRSFAYCLSPHLYRVVLPRTTTGGSVLYK